MAHNELSSQEQEVLTALRQSDEWIGRSELARRLGKERLGESDFLVLLLLIDKGLVETQRVGDNSPLGFAVNYHATQDSQLSNTP